MPGKNTKKSFKRANKRHQQRLNAARYRRCLERANEEDSQNVVEFAPHTSMTASASSQNCDDTSGGSSRDDNVIVAPPQTDAGPELGLDFPGSSIQLDESLQTAEELPEEPAIMLTDSSATENTPKQPNSIGPYSDAAGLKKHHFDGSQDLPLPVVYPMLKGHMLELFYYFLNDLNMPNAKIYSTFASLFGTDRNIRPHIISRRLNRLVEKYKGIKRRTTTRKEQRKRMLSALEAEELHFISYECAVTRVSQRKEETREAQVRELKETVEHQAKQLKFLKVEITEEEEIVKMLSDIRTAEEKYAALHKEVDTFKKDNSQYASVCNQLKICRKENRAKQQQINVLEKKCAKKQRDVASLKRHLSRANATIEEVKWKDERMRQLIHENMRLERIIKEKQDQFLIQPQPVIVFNLPVKTEDGMTS